MNQPIHLFRFIHNHGTVVVFFLPFLRDIFFQALRIAEDKGKRRFQLVRDIGHEFLAHFVQLTFFFHIRQQLAVFFIQFRDGGIQLIGQVIDAFAQFTDFVRLFNGGLLGKIEQSHALRQTVEGNDRAGKAFGEKERPAAAGKDRQNAGENHELGSDGGAFRNRRQRLTDVQDIAVIQPPFDDHKFNLDVGIPQHFQSGSAVDLFAALGDVRRRRRQLIGWTAVSGVGLVNERTK